MVPYFTEVVVAVDADVVEEVKITSRLFKLAEEDTETIMQYLVPTIMTAMKLFQAQTGKHIPKQNVSDEFLRTLQR